METLTNVGSSPIRRVLIDNVVGYDGATISSCVEDWAPATRSFTMGGYYRRGDGENIASNYRGGRDAYRYFDDLYVDNTFSRVMLCNNATYTSATICEPQIPSAWAAGEITVTVNQGALPNGTAYLFVFDSDNVANTTGYAVTLGGTTPPSATGCTISGGTFK